MRLGANPGDAIDQIAGLESRFRREPGLIELLHHQLIVVIYPNRKPEYPL